MTDDTTTADDATIEDTAGTAGAGTSGELPGDAATPLPLPDRVDALEQIVRGILLADQSVPAADGSSDAASDPLPGTAAPVDGTEDEDHGGPWAWTEIDDERRKELAVELVEFVRWLTDRYLRHLSGEQYQLPENWFECPPAVEMLTAVMVARQSVYSDTQTEPSFALSEWHERHLWPALDRMRALTLFKDERLTRQTPRDMHTRDDAVATLAATTDSVAAAADEAPDTTSNIRAADAPSAPSVGPTTEVLPTV